MIDEIFEDSFWLSTTHPKQIITEDELIKKHQHQIDGKHKNLTKEEIRSILDFYKKSNQGPILFPRKYFSLKLNCKIYKVYVALGFEHWMKDIELLDEEIY